MMNPFRSLTERLSLRVVFALFALYVIWGSTYLGIRIGLNSFPPSLMAGRRFLIAGSTLFVFLRVRGAPAPTRAQWAASAVVGCLLLGAGNGGVTFAEQWVSSGLAAVWGGTKAVWAALFGGVWGRWPNRVGGLGVVLGGGGGRPL